YVENCEAVPHWQFHLQWDGGSGEETTDENGHASWSGVPIGAWTGSESLGPGWGEPLIWCQYVEWPDEATHTDEWTPYTFENGGIQGHFPYDGYRIVCYWFNFEPEY